MSETPQRRSRKRKIAVWVIRVIYVVIIMAMVDSWSFFNFQHGIFCFATEEMRDGGTTISAGPGYTLTFWRRMDGAAYGPEIWFWGAPFVIDAAHHGVQVHWIWSHDDDA